MERSNQQQPLRPQALYPAQHNSNFSYVNSLFWASYQHTQEDYPPCHLNDSTANQFHAKKRVFRCPNCRYITDRKNNLKRHISTMHSDCGKALECCEIQFSSKASLRDHVCIFHRSGYRCQYCTRNFVRKALLKRHLTVHANGFHGFTMQSSQQQILAPNSKISNSAEERRPNVRLCTLPYKCSLCKTTFETQETIEAHQCPINDLKLPPSTPLTTDKGSLRSQLSPPE